MDGVAGLALGIQGFCARKEKVRITDLTKDPVNDINGDYEWRDAGWESDLKDVPECFREILRNVHYAKEFYYNVNGHMIAYQKVTYGRVPSSSCPANSLVDSK